MASGCVEFAANIVFGGSIAVMRSGVLLGLLDPAFHPNKAANNPSAAARIQPARSRFCEECLPDPGCPAREPLCAIQRSSRATSAALCHLSSASFSRHVLITCSSAGGDIGCMLEIGSGSLSRIAEATL